MQHIFFENASQIGFRISGEIVPLSYQGQRSPKRANGSERALNPGVQGRSPGPLSPHFSGEMGTPAGQAGPPGRCASRWLPRHPPEGYTAPAAQVPFSFRRFCTMENPLSQLPIPLLGWYQTHARDLPWRQEATPYRVWVSEIMLQQTRVAAVLGYFTAGFWRPFPTVQALAEVPGGPADEAVAGAGLLQPGPEPAKGRPADCGPVRRGASPRPTRTSDALAGVGDYTAGAIASIAFGLPVPAVDGNVLRVAARVTGDDADITTTP